MIRRFPLFGTLTAQREETVITRFRSYRTGILLAYLAYFRRRAQPREELVERLWPEVDEATGRSSLRTALTTGASNEADHARGGGSHPPPFLTSYPWTPCCKETLAKPQRRKGALEPPIGIRR